MKRSLRSTAVRVAAALAVALGGASAQAAPLGFVSLSSAGKPVLARCNPRNLASEDLCRVASLPGESGYTLVASRTSDVVKNEVVIGKLLDRVWKDDGGNHIFGVQLQLNANPFDVTGLAFNANDLFRKVRPGQPVAVAYFQGSATKALKKAGRTLQGLNELAPSDDDDDEEAARAASAKTFSADDDDHGWKPPVRDNGWVDFRIDANAAEVKGASSAHSPWLLLKTRAPAGYAVRPFAIRLLSSDVADSSQFTEIFLSGYQPK